MEWCGLATTSAQLIKHAIVWCHAVVVRPRVGSYLAPCCSFLITSCYNGNQITRAVQVVVVWPRRGCLATLGGCLVHLLFLQHLRKVRSKYMHAATNRRWLGDAIVDVHRLRAVWLFGDRLGHVGSHIMSQRLVITS